MSQPISQDKDQRKRKSSRPVAVSVERQFDSEAWKSVLDCVPHAVFVHLRDGSIVHANPQAVDIASALTDNIAGGNCADLFHSESSPCPHETVLITRQGATAEWSAQTGPAYSVIINPILSTSGFVIGFVRIMSELAQQQTTIEPVNVARLATLEQMFSGIAHDVGTPLNIILGYTEYLLMRIEPDARGHKELSTILEQTKRIADSIRQVVDLGRLSQGRTDAIGLKGFLDECVDGMAHQLRKAEVTARVTCETSSPLIYGDAPRLRQALIKLLSSAAKSIGSGGRLELVVDEAADDSTHVVVSIVGTDSKGRGNGFSDGFPRVARIAQSTETAGAELFVAGELLGRLGARLGTMDIGARGTSLVVHLPRVAAQSANG